MKKGILTAFLGLMFVLSGCNFAGGTSGKSSTSSNSSPKETETSSKVNEYLEDETHVDANADDRCDDCGKSVAVTFDLYAINDLHGKFEDTDAQPGVDELSTYLKNAKAKNENTLVLASGDMWQGSSESNLTKGMIVTEWMNDIGVVSMTLGNHEYDWGEKYIEENSAIAQFPFLALNIYDSETSDLPDYCQPSVMVEKNGAKIGIIGAIGDCYSDISPDKVQEVYFKTGSTLTALVKSEAKKLRQEGADCIIYSIHDGFGRSYDSTPTLSDAELSSYYDVELSDYVDIVFEGHTHQHYTLKDSKGVYHLQDGGDNDGISHAKIKINIANDKVTTKEAKFISTEKYIHLSDDPIVDELMEKYEDQIALAEKRLGDNARTRGGAEICQKVADLYYETAMEKWGDKYQIVLGGGFLQVRSPYYVYGGEVRYGDLMSVLPFDNPLVLCSIKGSDLSSRFFEDRKNYYVSYGAYGASVRENIVANKTYYVVTDRYTSLYSWNHLTEIETYDETTFSRDLLAAFIESGGWSA